MKKSTLNITAGTDVVLNDTLTFQGEVFDPSLSVNVEANLISGLGKRSALSFVIEDTHMIIDVPWEEGRLTGCYGLEVRGVTNGKKWATYSDSLIRYTKATEDGASSVTDEGDVYDITQTVAYRYSVSPIEEITADTDGLTGTPSVSVDYDGKDIAFHFNGIKGEKGDAFTYDDFTPEELESLRGPQGPKGNDGLDGVVLDPEAVTIFDDMADLDGKTEEEREKMIPSGKSLTSEETTSTAQSGYYNVGYGTTKFISVSNRVTVALPLDIVSCKIVSVASGYRAAIQQWSVEDPTLPITDVTGTRVSDSGWKTSAYEESKLSSANYVVFTMSKSDDGNISVSEAYANIVLSYSRVFNKIDDLTSKVSGLDDTVFGTDTVIIENNENSSSSRWAPYTAGNTQRGCYWLVLSNYKYQSYQVTFSIASGAPILVGGCIRNSSNPTGYMAYDSGWILPGNSHTFTNAVDSDDAGYAICFNTTYVSSTSQATTFAEFLQYCTFEVKFTDKTDGILPNIEELQRKKCLLATSMVKMVAHRGFHLVDVPENSIDAYRWAGFLGYDYVETDFCPTSDDELVLMHDASINRTMRNADYTTISGTVNVNSKTLAQLRENYVLASDDPRYRRPIPTLEEYFITCKESGLFAMPEIKQTGTTQAHVLAAYNMGLEIMGKGHFGFCSFSYALLDYARTLDDDLELWYIGSSILGTTNSITGDSRETASTVWYPSYTGYSLSASLVKQYHAKGMRVAVWTVPVSECDNMIKTGVDYIATDYVSSNLSKTDGRVYDETDAETNGVRGDGITLSAGQTAVINDRSMIIGLYYVSIIAKGNYNITAPNLSISVTDADFTRRIYKGIVDNKIANITITATGNTEIQFLNAKIVEVE